MDNDQRKIEMHTDRRTHLLRHRSNQLLHPPSYTTYNSSRKRGKWGVGGGVCACVCVRERKRDRAKDGERKQR